MFRSGSVGELVGVAGAVLDDSARRHWMGAAGVRAVAALDWPTVAGRVEDVYSEVLRRCHSFA